MGKPLTGALNARGVGKSCNFRPIARKRLKRVDGHMLRRVRPALNLLSIHLKFTAIVPGTYPGEAKIANF